MKLLQISGISESGHIWNHPLPAKSDLFTKGGRLLVVSPESMYWLDADGNCEQATSYPRRIQPDDGC